MITISVNTREAAVEETEIITTGSIGIQVHFEFSEEWDLLTRVAVFRAGDNPDWYDITLGPENTCVIPWELLTEENENEPLFIGAFGEALTDSVIAIPTVWTSAGAIRPGAHSGNAGSADPTPTQWSQIRMLADSAATSAESAQESAETAQTYAEHVPVVVDGYWNMWNGTDYVPTAQRAQGEDGTPGQDGNDGFSPVVVVNEIAGGHSVTITDAEGSDTFNVMDGEQGPVGPGVPEGGTTSQILVKKSADDYDGEWVDPTAELLTYDDSETYTSGTVGAEVSGLKNSLNSKVSKSGDTMTGALRVRTALSPTIPSENQYIAVFTGDNSNGDIVGVLQIANETTGIVSVALQAQKYVNGTFYSNNIRLGLNSDGQRTLGLDSGLWRATLGVPQIKRVTKSITTDQYGQAALPSPATNANLLNVWSDDYRYFLVKQNGVQVRVYNAATSNITVAATTTLNVTIVYTEA